MKFSLIVLGFSAVVSACTASVPVEDSKPVLQEPIQVSDTDNSSDYLSPCDRHDFETIILKDGTILRLDVPVLCDPNPMIYGGDPPPDKSNPDPLSKQEQKEKSRPESKEIR